MEMIRVSAKSNPNAVAGAIAGILRSQGAVPIYAIGAGSVNVAVKAIAIARGFVAPNGIDLIATHGFADMDVSGEIKTAIRIVVEPR